MGCADYLQRARIPGQDKARGATALLPLQGSALTLLVTYGAPLNTESAFWGTSLHTPPPNPCFLGLISFPPPPYPPNPCPFC